MFIKVDENGFILAHSNYYQNGLDINANIFSLLDNNGLYIYKYIEGKLIEVPEIERTNHPLYKQQQLSKLKSEVHFNIQQLDELKAHSIAAKKGEGIELSQEEQSFLTNFLSQRDVLLAQYELDKTQYE